MHPPSSTKLFNKPSRLVIALEGLSLLFALSLLLIWVGLAVFGLRITTVNCQMSDASSCGQEIQAETSTLLGQRSFFSSLQTQLVSATSNLSQQTLNYTFSAPSNLAITVVKTPPAYYCQTPQGLFAFSSQGGLQPNTNTTGVDQSELPTLIIDSEELAASLISSSSSELDFHLHPEITKLLAALKSANLDILILRLQDSESVSIAVEDNLQVLVDLNRLSGITSIPSIRAAPEWQLEAGRQYELDLRFQYPLLRKMD